MPAFDVAPPNDSRSAEVLEGTRPSAPGNDQVTPFASSTPSLPAADGSFGDITPKACIGFVGAFLIVLGTFAPIMNIPIVGTISAFQQDNIGECFLILAGFGGILGMAEGKKTMAVIGVISLVAVGADWLHTASLLDKIRTSAANDLAGEPFAGVARALSGAAHLEWGWVCLFVGAGLIAIAPFVSK